MKPTIQTFSPPRLHYKRAVVIFILAYIAVTILGIILSVSIAAVEHLPTATAPLQNTAYLISERFLPFMNLLVWTAFGWVYFRKRAEHADPSILSREAWMLGSIWLMLAVLVDYVGFVLIKNPISLSPHDFYVGQFPWIYLIYLAVLLSPWCFVNMARMFGWLGCSG